MKRLLTCHFWTLAPLFAVGMVAIGGCAPPPLRASFHSPNPTEKLYAIETAVRSGDESAVPHIIEQLDSDDPAVRMMAIAALERLTGQTHGYVHYAPRHERAEAIARWVEAHGGTGADGPSGPSGRNGRSGPSPPSTMSVKSTASTTPRPHGAADD